MDYRSFLSTQDPAVAAMLSGEESRQVEGMELIASENYVSPAVLAALGSIFTNKYSEGYPGKRYYGGQTYTDKIEQLAIDRVKQLFPGANFANVQPHSGCPANEAVYYSLLEPGDTVLGMDLSHGGHLSHGHPVTKMAKLFRFVRYKMKDTSTGEIDYDELRQTALQEKPKIILAGFSAYTRELDYGKFKEIADEVGAVTMMDVAHIAGLIAGKQLKNPFDFGFDIVTSTTHKTLRGPRGGLILSRHEEHAKKIDKTVFPGLQGGPHMNNIAAKAVAFGEALKPEFQEYAAQVIRNAKAMEDVFRSNDVRMISGGTDNHMLLIDAVTSWGATGGEAETALDEVHITLNKNAIADDPRSPMDPSGIRLGAPAMTTRGFREAEFRQVAKWINEAVLQRNNLEKLREIGAEVNILCKQFPVPGITAV
ncbi:serine hydroxymethyltransferase [Candidatus Peregrinibacteria bacterium]|nr:MAG: serine hydroxymethyltransferase [Candidatus Peregrinibacteria bacterium]